jgi:hypothetical protein
MNLSDGPVSAQIILDAKARFDELEKHRFDWRSFYNGYLEAAIPLAVQRTEMLRLIDDMLTMFQEDATTHATEERVEAWRELRKGWTIEKTQEV